MVARTLMAAVILFVGSPTVAQPRDKLLQAMSDYEKAQIHGDRPALNRLLAEDYLLVNGGGGREDKKAFISDLVDPAFKLAPYTIDHPVLRRWKNGAVSAGIAHETGTSDGKPFDACIRFADTWKLVSGHWHVVFTQVARMAPPTAGQCDR